MFNAGVRGKRSKDTTGIITVGEHFNQQSFLVPTVTRFAVTDGFFVDTNDTAADTAGSQTIVLYGSGFAPGATVLVGSTTIGAVTFLDSGRLTFSSPALGSGSYTIFVTNANGGTGILVPGLVYSGVPTFTTSAGSLGSVYETTAISTTVVATGDAPITYALSSGSLPSGSTLSSSGTISGTAPVDGSSTTYSFTVQATDAQLQDSVRSFSLTINTDVVSFSSPANNTTTSVSQNSPISNVTPVATSAAGYGVLYTSSGLPTGLSMNTSTGIISGTPTVVASNTSIITATANTTSRTAALYLNWTIALPGDAFWKYASLLMSANTVPNGNTFNTDLSTFNNEVVVVADTKPSEFHPFKEGYYSNYFDGTGDYLAILTSSAFNIATNSFTVEAWINTSSATQQSIFNISDTASSGYGAVRVQVLSNQTVQWLMGPGGSWGVAVTAGSITLGTWNHIAITRNGSSVYFFINGLQVGTTQTYATSLTTGGTTYIGYNSGTSFGFNGYISNFRLVNGTAVYTANTTLSTSPLTYVANTSLLTCQSNKLIDNSNNNFTIVKGGDTTVSPFSPFNGTPTTVTVPDANNYSMYFDGTGDYLDVTSNSVFVFGSSDFTIELWVHPTIAPSTNWNPILTLGFGGSGQEIRISQNINGTGYGYLIPNNSNNNNVYTGFGTLTLNQWHHLALVRNGSTVTLYRNGVSVGSTTSVSFNFTNTTLIRIGGGQASYSSDGSFGGYISNLRMVKGLAVYTGNFTVSTSPLAITQSSSANTAALTVVPTNGSSVYFDGTGDSLTAPSNAAFTMGTGDFTIECWVYPTVAPSTWTCILSLGVSTTAGKEIRISQGQSTYGTLGVLYPNVGDTTNNETNTGYTLPLNRWTHIALSRVGSSMYLFANGAIVYTYTSVGFNHSTTASLWIDNNPYNDPKMIGHISNVRIVKGTAVYTGTFTPPTTPLTAISGTSILTCQSTTLIDNSTNAFTITKVGDASVTNTFSPFANTALLLTAQANTVIDNSNNALTITTNGNAGPARNGPFANTTTVTLIGNEGSAYFDGTGDYLEIAHASNQWIGASTDFTIECWFNLTGALGSERVLIAKGYQGGPVYAEFGIIVAAGTNLLTGLVSSSGGSWLATPTDTVAIIQNTWYHAALVRSGTTLTLYKNGAAVATSTGVGAALYNHTGTIRIGHHQGGSPFLGYISNLRVIKGTALYTSAFVPSFAPLTPVANTVLLTAQTNLSSNTKSFVDESNLNSIVTGNGNATLGSFSPFGSSWSGYFDGTTDYLSGSSSRLNFGANDFSIEFWMWPVNISTNSQIIFQAGSGNLAILLMTNGLIEPGQYQTAGISQSTAGAIVAGAWHHVVLTRTGTAFRTIINGVLRGYGTRSFTPNNSSYTIGGAASGTSYTGYISNFKVIANSIPALYSTSSTTLATTIFTTPTNPSVSEANTVLLTCNSNRFVDYAPANNAITRTGDTSVSKFSPFSPVSVTPASYSVYFDGTGDYLTVPTNSALDFGSGDFTVEGWVLPNALASDWFLISASGSGGLFVGYSSTTTLGFGFGRNGVAWDYRVAGSATVGVWQHVAVTRSGTSMRLFVNGTQVGTTQTISTAYNLGTTSTTIGSQGANYYLNGYISNLRVVKGTAVYTSTFTPSTTPLTAIANTSLLTCQSTSFIDNSNNAFAITVNGDAKPVIQNPFTDTVGTATNYSANTFGNSVYFDGTGDFLSTPATGAFYSGTFFGTGKTFTVEAWLYQTTFQTASGYFNIVLGDASGASGTNMNWCVGTDILNKPIIAWFDGASKQVIGSTVLTLNTWNHVAWVVTAGVTTIYVNGVIQSLTGTTTLTNPNASTGIVIGVDRQRYYTGFISNLRAISGTALYTRPFVPSEQPLPVTSNTTLLLASTVGPSVTDATRNHNIETFGTARYVANNSPYYDTYSGYFDGTGDYLTFGANQANLGLGTGDFTFEFWFYATTIPSTEVQFFESQTTGSFRIFKRASSSGLSYDWYGGTSYLIKSDATITTNEWHHVAVSRTSGTISAYYDGTRVINQADSTSGVTPTANYNVGGRASVGAYYFTGNISNMRLIKGTGLYSGTTITVPTGPLTAVTNTQLLICNTNRFIDGSTNAFTITKFGDAKITTFEPFVGSNNSRFNSVYFGTKTDFLAIRPQPNLVSYSGDFTFELWVYPTDTSLSTSWGIWDSRQDGQTPNAMNFGLAALASPVTGSWRPTYYNGTSYYGTGTVLWNQWTHVAFVRSGTTMTFYVNGVAGGTATISGTQSGNITTSKISIGTKDSGLSGYGTVGYIADFRITNGYARTITVPTAPYDIK